MLCCLLIMADRSRYLHELFWFVVFMLILTCETRRITNADDVTQGRTDDGQAGAGKTCSDCKATEPPTLRHGRHKLLESRRQIENIQKDKSRPHLTRPQILFRTLINGRRTGEWRSRHRNLKQTKQRLPVDDDVIFIEDEAHSGQNHFKVPKDTGDKTREKDVLKEIGRLLQELETKQRSQQGHSRSKKRKQKSRSNGKGKNRSRSNGKGKNRSRSNGKGKNRSRSDGKGKGKSKSRSSKDKLLKDDPKDFMDSVTAFRRLENVDQKLYNKLEDPVRSLLVSMETLLKGIDWRTNQVCFLYSECHTHPQQVVSRSEMAFNSTRFIMMNGVRDALTDIINTNNNVYGLVRDTGSFTRDVYKRAHLRQEEIGPMEPLYSGTTLNVAQSFQDISKKYRDVLKLMDQIKMMKMKGEQLGSRIKRVRENLETNLKRNELRDLIFIANQTRMKLESEFKQSMVIRKYNRYTNMVTDVKLLTEDCRSLLRRSRNHIYTATVNTRTNMQLSRQKKQNGILPPPHTSIIVDPTDRQQLRILVKQASKHAQELQRETEYLRLKLKSLMLEAANIRLPQPSTGVALQDMKHNIQELIRVLGVIGYATEFQQEFIIPCLLRDTLDSECQTETTECMEGSGCHGIEGSGEDNSDGSDPTVDSDFEFESDLDPVTSKSDLDPVFSKLSDASKQVIIELGSHLSTTAMTLKSSCSEMTSSASLLKTQIMEKGVEWNTTKQQLDLIKSVQQEYNNFTSTMEKESIKYNYTLSRVDNIKDKIKNLVEVTKSKTMAAVMKAEKVVSKLQRQNSSDVEGSADGHVTDDDEDNTGADNQASVTDAISRVAAAQSELKNLRNHQSQSSSLCENVQSRITKIRSDIQELKNKVSKARLMMSSLQLPVQIEKNSYIKTEVKRRSQELSLLTVVQVCIKPQGAEDIILLIKGNNSDSYILDMTEGKLRLTVKTTLGQESKVTSEKTMVLNNWYTISLKRTGSMFNLTVHTTDGEPVDQMKFTTSDSDTHQPDPGLVYIGGDPQSTSNVFYTANIWKGCVANLQINGKIVPLFLRSNQGQNPKTCQTNCSIPTNNNENIRLYGTGFVEFPVKLFHQYSTVTSISIEVKTQQESAFIMSIYYKPRRFHLEVLLDGGTMLINTVTTTESISLQSQIRLNDNKFHHIKIEYRDGTTYPVLDGQHGQFAIINQDITVIRPDTIVLGGPQSKQAGAKFYPNFIGCLQGFEINDKQIQRNQMINFKDAEVGPCLDYIPLGGCVSFNQRSQPIKYKKSNTSNHVMLTISRDSRGTILHYVNEKIFDLKLGMDKEKLVVIETDKEDEIIFPPNNLTSVPISIYHDSDQESLKVKVFQSELSFTVKSTVTTGNGGWFGVGETKELPNIYKLTLGAANEEEDPVFIGSIFEFYFNSSLQNLDVYKEKNNLASCHLVPSASSSAHSETFELLPCRIDTRRI